MRDSRNVLHARLATARTKQKHNCGGINERVRANYRGVGNPQNRREPPGLYRQAKRENPRTAALLRQNDEPVSYGRSGEDSRWVRTVCQDSASCFGARRNSYFGGFKGGWKRWSTAT
jgi:hypothetical protein